MPSFDRIVAGRRCSPGGIIAGKKKERKEGKRKRERERERRKEGIAKVHSTSLKGSKKGPRPFLFSFFPLFFPLSFFFLSFFLSFSSSSSSLYGLIDAKTLLCSFRASSFFFFFFFFFFTGCFLQGDIDERRTRHYPFLLALTVLAI